MIRKNICVVTLISLFSLVIFFLSCESPPEPPAQPVVQTQQLSQKIADLEKRIKTVEDASPAAFKSVADLRKDLGELKLRLNLIETRPIQGGLSPQDRTLLDTLDKRLKALEPAPTPTRLPGTTPTPTPAPPAAPASAAALTALEKRVGTLEQQVQQLGKQPASAPAQVQAATPTPAATPKAPDLRIVNHSQEVDKTKNTVTISGEVTNLGNATASTITVVVTLYKIDGTALGGGTGMPIVRTLAPGESSPFSLTIKDLDLTKYNSTYTARATTTQ